MIVFDLSCKCGCQFEGWFQDSDDFRRLAREGLLNCPSCDGNAVRKILSPVAVRSVVERKTASAPVKVEPEELAADLFKSLQNYVVNNYEDVGTRLAEESLKMHYGLEEPRNIRGTSTGEEEKVLAKEGIELLKIPLPVKSDKN
jgi:hypothetical protein